MNPSRNRPSSHTVGHQILSLASCETFTIGLERTPSADAALASNTFGAEHESSTGAALLSNTSEPEGAPNVDVCVIVSNARSKGMPEIWWRRIIIAVATGGRTFLRGVYASAKSRRRNSGTLFYTASIQTRFKEKKTHIANYFWIVSLSCREGGSFSVHTPNTRTFRST